MSLAPGYRGTNDKYNDYLKRTGQKRDVSLLKLDAHFNDSDIIGLQNIFKNRHQTINNTMAAIKAKFNCDSLTKNTYCETAFLSPVISGSEENKSFSKATPSGKIELCITNEDAYGAFVPGKSYYITIEQAD